MKKLLLALALLSSFCAVKSNAQGVPNSGGNGVPNGGSGGSGAQISGTFNAGDIVIGKSSTSIGDTLFFGTNGGISMSGGGTPSYGNCYWNDTNTCTTENIRARERVFIGNAVGMIDNQASCCSGTFLTGSATGANWIPRDAQTLSMSDIGGIALAGISQTATTPASHSSIGLTGYGMNNVGSGTATAWGAYFEGQHNPATTSGSQTFGIEVDCKNASASNDVANPYALGSGCYGLQVAGGGGASYGPTVTNPANAAIVVLNNETAWNEGIVFSSTGVTADGNGNMKDIVMPQGGALQWYLNSTTLGGAITSQAAGQIQLGGLDQAAPATQTISGQNTLTGTSNIAGGALVIAPGKGTGNQSSGSIFFTTAFGSTSGSNQNALLNTMVINSGAQSVVISGNGGSGGTTAAAGSYTPPLILKNNSASGNGESIFNWQNAANAPSQLILALSKSNTLNTQAAVTTADQLGILFGEGSDGTAFQKSSDIEFNVDAAVSSGIVPGRIVFKTANASGTLTEGFRLDSTQIINFAAAGIAANGSVATALTSLGPTGSHTTVQEWIVVKGTGGATRWIPAF